MLSKKFLCFSLIVLIITISAVSAEDNTTVELQALNETANSFGDIQNSIEKAQINETIILNGTYEGTGSEIVIDKDITLDGLGTTTLNANHNSRILNITAGNVILKNINFINAKSPTNGGAITSSARLTVINCSFSNNLVDDGVEYHQLMEEYAHATYNTGSGGAINANADLSVINSTFTNNSAYLRSYYRDMDAIVGSDEGLCGGINCLGDLYIEKSYFSKNSPYSIKALNADIRECNFENQQEVFKADKNCNVSFSYSNFENSGNIFSYSADLNINYCNFTNAECKLIESDGDTTVVINNSRFINNSIDEYETSLISIGKAQIINSTFINNHAGDTAVLELGEYELKNCTFTNNSDATILGHEPYEDAMLDDNLNPFCLFKVKIKNNPKRTYYDSGDAVKVYLINKKSNKHLWTYGLEAYINGRERSYFDDNPMFLQKVNYLKFPVSKWKVGEYSVDIYEDNPYTEESSFEVTVLKAPTIIKAPKVTNKKYFKVKVTHKITKNPVKSTWIKLKIGKTIYKVKTNKKGVAKFNTKNLSKGKHKVKITSGNSNYKMSAKSTITIR